MGIRSKKKPKNIETHTFDTIRLSDTGFGKVSRALPEYYKRYKPDFWIQIIINLGALIIGIFIGGAIGAIIGFAIVFIISLIFFNPYGKIKKIRREHVHLTK